MQEINLFGQDDRIKEFIGKAVKCSAIIRCKKQRVDTEYQVESSTSKCFSFLFQ